MSTPLVSICCLTFNHERYIRDAIEGFLMQQTDFPIEIIIHDDASTDQTAEIIKAYEARYSDIIKPIIQSENQWSKGVKPSPTYVWPKAQGKYIALCEGDDYWTDPLKLQKQVDVMEKNEEYSLCSGGFMKNYNDKVIQVVHKNIVDKSKQDKNGFTFDLNDAAEIWLTKTLTVLFKKAYYSARKCAKYQNFRDVHLFHDLLKSGKGYYFQQVFGVYNIHHGGIHSLKDKELKYKSAYEIYNELYKSSPDIFTRTMKLRATLSLLGFEIRNEGVSSILKQRKLLKEIISLLRKPQDLIWIFKEFVPTKIKNSIKDFSHI